MALKGSTATDRQGSGVAVTAFTTKSLSSEPTTTVAASAGNFFRAGTAKVNADPKSWIYAPQQAIFALALLARCCGRPVTKSAVVDAAV